MRRIAYNVTVMGHHILSTRTPLTAMRLGRADKAALPATRPAALTDRGHTAASITTVLICLLMTMLPASFTF